MEEEKRSAGPPAEDQSLPEVDFSEFPPSDYAAWKEAAAAALKGAPFEKVMLTRTYEGITLEPLYTEDHTPNPASARSFPSGAPMLRGTKASGYLGGAWEIAQDCTYPTPEATASAIKHELERGATTITFRAGDPPATRVSSTTDAKKALDGIDTSERPFHVYAASSDAVKFLIKAAGELGTPGALKGCIGLDPIGECLLQGKVPDDAARLFDSVAEVIRAAEDSPGLRTVLLRGAVFHDAGANAAQEAAYVLTNAIEIAYELQSRGFDIDDFARSVRFEFELGSNFFMEIAKIRAVRAVWSRVAEEFSGPLRDESSMKAEIFGRTSFFTKTIYDPYVNMLRNATEAFSAVMGGVDGLTVAPFDEAARPGGEFSRRVARNSQIMLQEEFHLTAPIDPAGGSWYIEYLTEELSRKIWSEIQDIQASGGMLACVKSGRIQSAINDVLTERFRKLASRSDRAVGINMYVNISEASPKRVSRPETHPAAGGVSVPPLLPRRWTEQFEELRSTTEEYRARTGDNVKVFLANMGPLSQHKARADFITGFMEVAAFEIIGNDGWNTTDECADAAAASGADAAVICSSDAAYPEIVPPLARRIKEKKPSMKVYLAGSPAEEVKRSYADAGVDGFVNVRSDCLSVLKDMQKEKGMRG